jgi:hypothetical protein
MTDTGVGFEWVGVRGVDKISHRVTGLLTCHCREWGKDEETEYEELSSVECIGLILQDAV